MPALKTILEYLNKLPKYFCMSLLFCNILAGCLIAIMIPLKHFSFDYLLEILRSIVETVAYINFYTLQIPIIYLQGGVGGAAFDILILGTILFIVAIYVIGKFFIKKKLQFPSNIELFTIILIGLSAYVKSAGIILVIWLSFLFAIYKLKIGKSK